MTLGESDPRLNSHCCHCDHEMKSVSLLEVLFGLPSVPVVADQPAFPHKTLSDLVAAVALLLIVELQNL